MELGSEYNLELNQLNTASRNLFDFLKDYQCEFFNSGRSAIKQIPFRRDRKILLPEFICESVSLCFPMEQVEYYRITEDLQINLEDLYNRINPDVGTIFVAHYFGAVQDAKVLKQIRTIADEHFILVIEDTTQSLFSKHESIGDYMVASVRKWMPIPMGGVLYTQKNNPLPSTEELQKCEDNTRAYGMILKNLFLKNALDCNREYRRIFIECEEKLDESDEIVLMSDFARFIVSCIDIEQMIQVRKKNYKKLLAELGKLGIKPVNVLSESDCPFVLTIRVANRNELRTYLMEKNIYCAVHWPFDRIHREQRKMAERNSETLISLPVDQRYGNDEMQYLADSIAKFGGELLF